MKNKQLLSPEEIWIFNYNTKSSEQKLFKLFSKHKIKYPKIGFYENWGSGKILNPKRKELIFINIKLNKYDNFMKILPCDKCSRDALEYINMISDFEWSKILKTRDSFIKWTWVFHDYVNNKLDKVSPKLDTFKKDFIDKKTPYVPSWRTFFNRLAFFILFILFCLFYARYLRTAR